MTHVGVHRARTGNGYVIDVSVDGAPFTEHWFLGPRGTNQTDQELAAKSDARMYAAGMKFAGAEVKLTAFGDDVHVPQMPS